MTAFTADIQVSITDIYNVTGTKADIVTLQNLTPQAVSTIETISGVFFEAAYREVAISVSDAAWLKKAACYQTQFMLENPDLLSRPAVSSLSQDGVSVSAPDGLTFVLAPLARRSLGNVSWAKSGTLRVAPAIVEKTDVSFLTSDAHDWAPLGAV
jgi:hypothetical protein